ncbi:MAG: molybdenum cofactor guanylyltransferase MobA [Pseudomonadota bacterium]
MTPVHSNIVGVLLAGGLSRRMGGGDKSLLDVAGQSMMQHVVDRLSPQVTALAINANGDPARFAAFGLPVVPDTIDGFVGPLAGVLAGMRWAETLAEPARWVVTASTDAPFIPEQLVARLRDEKDREEAAIALAKSGGHLHPVIGLWPVGLADDLEAALRDGIRKVLHWTDRHGIVAVDFPFVAVGSEEIDPFFNANTPEELDRARELVQRGGLRSK